MAKGAELLLAAGVARPLGFWGRAVVPAGANEDPRSLEMRWTKPLVNQEFCGEVRRGWGGQNLSFRCKDGKRLKFY